MDGLNWKEHNVDRIVDVWKVFFKEKEKGNEKVIGIEWKRTKHVLAIKATTYLIQYWQLNPFNGIGLQWSIWL